MRLLVEAIVSKLEAIATRNKKLEAVCHSLKQTSVLNIFFFIWRVAIIIKTVASVA